MVPFRIFRSTTVLGANVCGFFLGAVVFANFFLLTLYVQQVLDYSALKTGLTFLATAGTVIPVAGRLAGARHEDRAAPGDDGRARAASRRGMLWYTQIPTHGSFCVGPPARLPARRRRHGVLVHPDVDRRARRRRARTRPGSRRV